MVIGGTNELCEFLGAHPRLFVLTGAGISTASGIPDYRDANGDWKRPAPIQFHDFVNHHATRQRYWARSLVGWPWFQRATPNRCHTALAEWERRGMIAQLVTQNVDRLHQQAGAERVVDLHGRLDQVRCLDCDVQLPRQQLQDWLTERNPDFVERTATIGPDGDATLEDEDVSALTVPSCPACGGTLKPDVVFFGEAIPRQRVESTVDALRAADALLVTGSSLMVYSGYRYCRLADEWGMPQIAINPGRTRADALFRLKLSISFEEAIDGLADTPFGDASAAFPTRSAH